MLVWFGPDVHCLGIEMPGLGYLLGRAHEVAFGEQFSRADIQLAAHHFFIQAVVAVYHHLVDARLRSLHHAHFEVDRVAMYVLFDRHELEEKISTVHV